ncbi:uncharacterized protein LOC109859860 [Pseudomyrmex gracilis]|uniref:uncharacterized protein LOC109859860 n=1 Tax=Pseudomyrmex gracilis TaxID=219809 RepID=UPI000995DA0C|nr:uncharacterized protein LOC109859860 [Pseudomyrmex gracilis]
MLENCRWLLYVSRFSGCHPLTLDERSTFTRFQQLLMYSCVTGGVYCFGTFYANYPVNCIAQSKMIVGCPLRRIARYNRGLYLITTLLLSCLRHEKFELALAAARKFDDSIHHRSYADNIRTNRYTQWLVISAICASWFLVGTLGQLALRNVFVISNIVQITMRVMFSVEIAKFCFLYDALCRRFRYLNGLCQELTGDSVSRMYTKRFTVSSLERLHRHLTDATNHLNSYYSPQLLCWTACILIDIVAFSFTVLYAENTVMQVCLQIIIILLLSLQLIAISRYSDLTCNQANAFAMTLYSVEDKRSMFENTETSFEAIELGIFLRAHPLRVNVCGLFNLSSQFTCSAFGVILMYVILASSIH